MVEVDYNTPSEADSTTEREKNARNYNSMTDITNTVSSVADKSIDYSEFSSLNSLRSSKLESTKIQNTAKISTEETKYDSFVNESVDTENITGDESLKEDNDEADRDEGSVVSHAFSNSELHEYEPFMSDSQEDTEKQPDPIEVRTEDNNDPDDSMLIQKAVTYPVQSLDDSRSSSAIGARKEKDVIDGLRHENFQLKLKIVVIESQLNQSSGEGVAELRKQLAETQAAKITVQHENSKLRKTISNLNKNQEQENDQAYIEKDIKIKTLEENILYFQDELHDMRNHCDDLEKSFLERENQYEEALREEQATVSYLQNQLQEQQPRHGAKRYSDNYKSEPTPSASHRAMSEDYASPARDISQLYSQVENIKKSLASPNSRSRSRLSNSSATLQDSFHVDTEGMDAFSDLLKQIQDAAHSHATAYSALQREYDILSEQYENLASDYEKMDQNVEIMFAEQQEKHSNDVANFEKQLRSKDMLLSQGQEELEQLWDHMESLKTSIDELEGLKIQLQEAQDEVQARDAENFKLKTSYNSKNLELQSCKNEIDKMANELDELKSKEEESRRIHSYVENKVVGTSLPVEQHEKADELEAKLNQVLSIIKSSYDENATLENLVEVCYHHYRLFSYVLLTILY